MVNPKNETNNQESFYFPFMGYAGYSVTKIFYSLKAISFFLDKFETLVLKNDINDLKINKPIYITGLARAGTTILLEILCKHPDLASHRYKHLLIPYLPHSFSKIAELTNVYTKPFERLHKDGIFVTRESPEAVEERFWQQFFHNTHNENRSNIISGTDSNPKFERFYQNHILKLMFNQNRPRYLAKNNYNITRLNYLLRLFPDSKFLVIIRNPINQIASLIKQTELFTKMEREKPILNDWLKISGHHEFGHHRVCINVGNTELIRKIRKLWKNRKTYVKGWAYYWDSIYDFFANQIDENKRLKDATLIVRYNELCETPEIIINKILDHTELTPEKFNRVKSYYVKHLHEPTYYTPNFSEQEREYIIEITKSTATRLGLSITKI
ncbi:MAG: sulfotransferase [Promethearchaeota archaeon]|jgi:hypothetical protein